jgi:CHAT domain-containing protein
MSDYVRAEAVWRQAVEILKKRSRLPPGDLEYAGVLAKLARLYQEGMRDAARAEPLYREAMEIMKKEREEGSTDLPAEIPFDLGLLAIARADRAQAEAMLGAALGIKTGLHIVSGHGVATGPQLELLAESRFYLDIYLGVALEAGTAPEALYRRVLEWKGAWAGRQMSYRPVQDRPELKPLRKELESVRSLLAQLAFTAPAPAGKQIWREQLDALLQRKERLEAEVSLGSASFLSGRQSMPAQLGDVALALPAGTVLVDFVEYAHAKQENPGLAEPRLLAFIVRPNPPIVCVPLGNVGPVCEAVLAWRAGLLAHRSEAVAQSAATLGRLVWEPLRPHLKDAKSVMVAPDSWLTIFPFAAMPGRKPGTYLIEDLAISYMGSGPEAAALLGAPQVAASGGLLAAGAIDFLADPGGSAPRHPWQRRVVIAERQRGGFAPLPGTKAEGELARDLFRRSFPNQPAVFLTGAGPSEGEIKKRLDGGHWRAVHLGSHGFFEGPGRIAALRASMRRRMRVDLASKREKADDDSSSLELGPFLNSGIVLAGGGRAPDTEQPQPPGSLPQSEDGILTAEEVQSLDMSGTEMVVLSACETGLGQRLYGQGMLGLQRAFHVAGAKAVIASLWKVEDAATSVLMEQFYTNLWVKKMPKLEALRQAQLTVLNNPGMVTARRTELAKRGIEEKPEKLPQGGAIASPDGSAARSDPSLWAAFVLSGDFR